MASAVILPEAQEPQIPLSGTLKRRQSSISDDRAKRPRFNEGGSNGNRQGSAASPPDQRPVDRASERRKSGQVEERKRGQRLFGALQMSHLAWLIKGRLSLRRNMQLLGSLNE